MKLYTLLLVVVLLSCTKKKVVILSQNADVPPITRSIDTVHVSYSAMVKPTLSIHCYACHSAAVTDGGKAGFDLESFDSFKTYLKIFYRNDSIYGSKFFNTILQSPTTLPMPPAPGAKLDSYDLRMIKKWINAGAPNN